MPSRAAKTMTTDTGTSKRGQVLRRATDHFDVNEVFAGGGEMGALMRSMDWASTPLGPPEQWPQSLRTTVSLLLNSRYPMFVFWGPSLVKIYNEGYRPILAAKHPWALGRPGPEVWPEIWSQIGPMVARVVEEGEATWSEDLVVFMERKGFPEECYFTFSYSPVRDESGGVGGMFCACTETTEKVLGERRIKTLRDLAARPTDAATVDEACVLSCEVLGKNIEDTPFALLYLLDEESGDARLVAASGTSPDEPVSPLIVKAADLAAWPLSRVAEARREEIVSDLASRFPALPAGAWPEPPKQAMVLPLVAQGHERAVGVLVFGVGSRRPLDEPYHDFFSLVTNQIATSVAKIRALEEERRRAEALAEIDRAKTAFFSNVSHEFRTPLTLMMGPVEDALRDVEDPLSPRQRERQELVRRNGLRLQKLVNTLLDFARIEAGRAHAAFVPTDLAMLTTDLVSSFRAALEKAGLRFIVDCPPLPEATYVDPVMWEKIVLNLLSNAFKFTFEGEVRVHLRSVDGNVEFVVADTGTGIPADELPHIFKRFHRVEGARSRSHEGSGIGLALVQELVWLHGGNIKAESKYGSGTSFTLTIPKRSASLLQDRAYAKRTLESTRAEAAIGVEEALSWLLSEEPTPELMGIVQQLRPATMGLDTAPVRRAALGGARILVADDNADMRAYLRRILEERWTVETVTDGEAAFVAAQARRPDLILTDIMMPVLDGFGLLQKLRGNPTTAAIPVVMLSARAGEESRVEGLEAGAEDYLVKPFSARELVARVRTHLELARLREEVCMQQARLFSLFTQAPIPICVLHGPELVFELANPPYCEIFGRSNLVGKPWLEVFPEAGDQGTSGKRFEDLLRDVMTAETPLNLVELPVTIEREGVTAAAYFNTVWAPIRSAEGSIDRLMGIATEVTDQVRARRQADEAARQLKDAMALRDEFLTIASHELRTPLTTLGLHADGLIRGLLQAHESEAALQQSLERAEKVRHQADRLEDLIEGLVDAFSLGRDALQLNLTEIDLAEVAQAVVERFQKGSKKTNATIHLRAESSVGSWDRRRIEQILSHLVSNALKFGAAQPIDVVVGGSATSARVLVKDRGIGILAEEHERVFERFIRVAPVSQYSGFGLGLWIVRELVQAMGGSIRVESQLGAGATFVVELPRRP